MSATAMIDVSNPWFASDEVDRLAAAFGEAASRAVSRAKAGADAAGNLAALAADIRALADRARALADAVAPA